MKKKIIISMMALMGLASIFADEVQIAKPSNPNPGLKYYYPVPKIEKPTEYNFDVVVYGGTPAGVMAAIQTKRMGRSVGFFVFRRHVGGLTSGGLTGTDLGKIETIGGLAAEFLSNKDIKWSGFLSSNAERVFLEMLAKEGVPVFFEHRLEKVIKEGNKITKVTFENGNSARGKVFIDSSYEGDLMAYSGVSYIAGRESSNKYNEKHAGKILTITGKPFRLKVDPYKVPGNPESGLIEGVSCEQLTPEDHGKPDNKFQGYCFRMTATKKDFRPWPKPDNYRLERYELLKRFINAAPDTYWDFTYRTGPIKLNEGDCNNGSEVSIDYLGGNYNWAEGSYAEREQIFQDHVDYQKGYMYFLAHDESVPQRVRDFVNTYGLSKTEFPETEGWSHELYVREARRMVSDYVMTQNHGFGEIVAEDGVGLASYTMDSHNVQRFVKGGRIHAEGGFNTFIKQPYPVSYKSIVPKKSECENLIVPVAVSASHVAFGSVRMEPVFMILGQSSGVIACMSIYHKVPVQDLDYPLLRKKLLQYKQKLDYIPKEKNPEKKPAKPVKAKEESPEEKK